MTYFARLFRFNKLLFSVVLFFCVLTILANLLKTELTPFFVWGMYSEKEKNPGTYDMLEIKANGNKLVDYSSGFTDANRFYLSAPLNYYLDIQRNAEIDPQKLFLQKHMGKTSRHLYNDSTDQAAFPKWYMSYLENSMQIRVDSIQIISLEIAYDQFGKPAVKSSHPLASWKK